MNTQPDPAWIVTDGDKCVFLRLVTFWSEACNILIWPKYEWMGGASQDDGVSHIRLFRNRGSSGLILYDHHLSGNCTRPPVIVSHLIESPPFQCFHGLASKKSQDLIYNYALLLHYIIISIRFTLSLNNQIMIVPNRQLILTCRELCSVACSPGWVVVERNFNTQGVDWVLLSLAHHGPG